MTTLEEQLKRYEAGSGGGPAIQLRVADSVDYFVGTNKELRDHVESAKTAQTLFEAYRAEAEKSHAGEEFQKFVRALLMRATECGAFKP